MLFSLFHTIRLNALSNTTLDTEKLQITLQQNIPRGILFQALFYPRIKKQRCDDEIRTSHNFFFSNDKTIWKFAPLRFITRLFSVPLPRR